MFWGGGGIEKFLKLFAKLSGQRGYTEVTSNTFIGTDQTPSKIPEISFIKLVYRLRCQTTNSPIRAWNIYESS